MQYLIQVYLPSCMFVVVSWVSFLIKPEVVPGRMALLVTLFLVLINIFNSVRWGPHNQLNANKTLCLEIGDQFWKLTLILPCHGKVSNDNLAPVGWWNMIFTFPNVVFNCTGVARLTHFWEQESEHCPLFSRAPFGLELFSFPASYTQVYYLVEVAI